MKHLSRQIKFIDTKLLPLFGFKNIIDYTFILCISDLDNLKIDLDKLNGLIEEFRKVFHSKNFSLHKTQYKILTKSQAICLLKTCLEITSIPFDISLKKNKKYLRLICKNNILEDYINTLKMSENSSFSNENTNLKNYVVSEWQSSTIYPDNHENEKNEKNEKLFLFSSETEKNNIKLEEQMDVDCKIMDYKLINKLELRTVMPEGLKEFEKPKIFSKEQLNEGIKKINNVEFFLSPKKLVRIEKFNQSVIEINMKNYDLADKILKSFCVKFISKKINNQPIIAESFIEHLTKNMKFKVNIGGSCIWVCKFTNDSNCIIDDVILPNKCLQLHPVILCLTNIDDVLHLLENLEIKVSCECVNLYTEIDNIIEKSSIEQLIRMEDKYNILRITCGMGGNTYSEYLNLNKFNELTNNYFIFKNEVIELNQNDIIKESDLFIGNQMSFGDIDGFEITNCSKNFINKNASNALDYKYDFVCWDMFYEIKTKGVEYYRIPNKNTFIHFYKINIYNYDEQIPHSISKLQIIANFKLNKILKTTINYCENNGQKSDIPVKYNLNNNMLELDLQNKHLLLNRKITDIEICFESINEEELIGEKITVVMKAFEWKKKYISFFTSNNMMIIDPNTISQEYEKYINDFINLLKKNGIYF